MIEQFGIELLRESVTRGRIQWHLHALERFLERGISRAEVLDAIMNGEIIELYPTDRPFPSCLVLHDMHQPLHVVAAGDPVECQCHIITAYRPELQYFESDFRTRRKKT